MNTIAKEKNSLNLAQNLFKYKKFIVELPISVKKSECTIQRFFLYLLPVINLALEQNPKEAKDLFVKYVDLLANSEIPF